MLITRQEITKNRSIISTEITLLQKAFFDEELLEEYREEGKEEVYWQMFDSVKNETSKYEIHQLIVGINHPDLETFPRALYLQIRKSLELLQARSIFVLSGIKLDFFGQKNSEYPELKKAYQALEKLVGSTSYLEAFHCDLDQLEKLLEIFFITVRCDPETSDYILFFDSEERFMFNICKYGNLHWSDLGERNFTKNQWKKLGWQIITGPEIDQFTEDGKIEGRTISF